MLTCVAGQKSRRPRPCGWRGPSPSGRPVPPPRLRLDRDVRLCRPRAIVELPSRQPLRPAQRSAERFDSSICQRLAHGIERGIALVGQQHPQRSTRLAASVRERAIETKLAKSSSPIDNSIACRHAVMTFGPGLRIKYQVSSHHGPDESRTSEQFHEIDELGACLSNRNGAIKELKMSNPRKHRALSAFRGFQYFKI